MATIDDIELPSLLFSEVSAPATPASGFGRLYVKTTGVFFKGDDGVEIGPFGAAGGATNLQSASYKRTAGDYTTTSATFVDVDATNFALTITTGARRCMVGLVGTAANSSTNTTAFDIDIDGVRQGGDEGLVRPRTPVAAYRANASFVFLTAALTAASHTFKLQWKASAGTSTLYGTTTAEAVAEFWVAEIYAA